MFHDAHLENLRRAFAAQFEPNAAGYVYRHGRRGAPVQVTSGERDAFIAAFDSQTRWAGRSILFGTIALLGGVAMATANGELPDKWFYALVAGLSLAMLGFYYWARAAPARALVRRPMLGNPQSGGEIQARLLGALNWQMLAIGAGVSIVLIVLSFTHGDPAAGWNAAGIAIGIAMLALFVMQGARKWRAGRRL